jgi:hypothetical protein
LKDRGITKFIATEKKENKSREKEKEINEERKIKNNI